MADSVQLTSLERFVFIDCRVILLHIIGSNYQTFAYKHNINMTALNSFVKYGYEDYLRLSEGAAKTKFRYLTVQAAVKILEGAGYRLRCSLELSGSDEVE